MILFFADNHHTRDYFHLLMKEMNQQGVATHLYYDKKMSLPAFHYLKKFPQDFWPEVSEQVCLEYLAEHKKPIPQRALARIQNKLKRKFSRDMAELEKYKPSLIVVWNGLKYRRRFFVKAADALNIPVVFMENGLLPNTTVCDPQGVNARNIMPRDAAFYLDRAVNTAQSVNQQALTVRDAKKPKRSDQKALPDKFIFVPFQVDSDTQITLFSPWIKNMQVLFELMCEAVADTPYKLVFKEHPSSPVDYAYLHDELDESIGIFANDYLTQTLIEKASAVVTINSTIAIESLLFEKTVMVLGEAFFTIEGLVYSADSAAQLKERISQLDIIEPNAPLRESFLDYLQTEYLVQGSWKEASYTHIQQMVKRVLSYLPVSTKSSGDEHA